MLLQKTTLQVLITTESSTRDLIAIFIPIN